MLSNVVLVQYTTLDLPVAPVQKSAYPDRVSYVGRAVNVNLGSVYWSSNAGAMTYREIGLPGGLAMDVNTGIVTGTPNTISTAQVDIYAANSEGESGPGEFQWEIKAEPPGFPNDKVTLTDARHQSLVDQGFTGTTSDMLLQWANSYGTTSDHLNDAMLQHLNLMGGGDWRTLTDAWWGFLTGAGYTGSRNDMETEYWQTSGVAVGSPNLTLARLETYLVTKGWDADVIPSGKLRVKLQGQPSVLITLQELIAYIYQNLPGIPAALVADIDDWRG